MFEDWYRQTVTVDIRGVADQWGATAVTTHTGIPCYLEDGAVLVRAADGTQTLSTCTLSADLTYKAYFPAGALVHLPDRTAEVISVGVADSTGDWPDLEGITVHLT